MTKNKTVKKLLKNATVLERMKHPSKKETILKKWTKAVVVKTNVNTSQTSRSKNCKLRSTASKEEELETPRESKPKTSKHATTRRRK